MESILAKKLNLIEWLLKISDDAILSKIELLRKLNVDYWDELTKEQQEEIDEAFAELEHGKGVSHTDVMAKFQRR